MTEAYKIFKHELQFNSQQLEDAIKKKNEEAIKLWSKKVKKKLNSAEAKNREYEDVVTKAKEDLIEKEKKIKEELKKRDLPEGADLSKEVEMTAIVLKGLQEKLKVFNSDNRVEELKAKEKEVRDRKKALDKIQELWADDRHKLQLMQTTVDVCLMLDVTGSMGSWLDQAKTKLKGLVEEFQITYQSYTFRFSIICYRDITSSESTDGARIESQTFTTVPSNIVEFLSGIKASGGGDLPEDVNIAISRAASFSWLAMTRVLIHIADAPAHGERYYGGTGDSHPNASDDLERNLISLAKKRVDYTFVQINPSTIKMTNEFSKIYQAYPRRRFSVVNFSDASSFPDIIRGTLTASIQSSITNMGTLDNEILISMASKLNMNSASQ